MIFLNEDLLTDNFDDYSESVEESLLAVSESVNVFTEDSLNADIAMQETLMESVYLEAKDNKSGAIANFFKGILKFVKKIWQAIKDFVGNIYTRIHMTSAKLIKIIDAMMKDNKYKEALAATKDIAGLKVLVSKEESAYKKRNKKTKATTVYTKYKGKTTLIDGKEVKTIVDSIKETTKQANAASKKKGFEKISEEQANVMDSLNDLAMIIVETSDKALSVKLGDYLKEYKQVATAEFEKNFKQAIKDLKDANKNLESAANEGISSSDENLAKVQKRECSFTRNLVSGMNRSIGKLVGIRSGYTANAYKVIQTVRSLAKK